MSDRLDELNQICINCQRQKEKRLEQLDPNICTSFCPTGREIHKIEVMDCGSWTKVDWNSSKFKDYYHG